MRTALLLAGGLALVAPVLGCGLAPQALTSPCLGQTATDGGACPACAVDADCVVVGNRCHASASCVPRAGNWATTMEGCAVSHPAPVEACACAQQTCQKAPTR